MTVRPLAIINSLPAVKLALWLARQVPPDRGHRIATFLADLVSRNTSWDIVRAMYSNQTVVQNGKLTPAQLKVAVRDTFRSTARCIYDLYHNLGDVEGSQRLVHLNDHIRWAITCSQTNDAGFIVVSSHLSNIDLLMQTAAMMGLQAQAIALANPTAGYKLQNELRQKAGLDLTPASKTALRQARKRLLNGGIVMTGLDRPLPGSRYQPRFFDRPAALPVHHIQLALNTDAPIMVVGVIYGNDGVYQVEATEPIPMKRFDDRRKEIIHNAEILLEITANFIRRAPTQWSMYYPVWPQVQYEFS
jgi:phosphatidylinositol dimannoside acyltransferase